MKILIPTVGTRGDVQPYLDLAQALAREGFQPVIATHPCWSGLVEEHGVAFVPIGPDVNIEYEAAHIREKSSHWMLGMIRTMKFVFRIIEGSSDALMTLCRDASLVIVPHSHIGAAEAEACQTPYISVTIQPGFIPEKRKDRTLGKTILDNIGGVFMNPLMVGPYNGIRKKLGLKKVQTFYDLLSPAVNIIPISPAVFPKNEFWDEKNRVTGYWFWDQNEEYDAPESLENFIKDGQPPVVVSLGAMAFESRVERAKLAMFVGALQQTGMRAIFQGFNKTLLNFSLPDQMISVGSIPHQWLFRHAYCVIHHGGFGTTAAALREGVPSIVIPHVLDQYEWANRVYGLHAGPRPIPVKELTQERITAAINELKQNYTEIRQHTERISWRINAEKGLENTIDLINAMLR